MDIVRLQKRLIAKGYNIGAADGQAGPMTFTGMFAYAGSRPMGAVSLLGKAAAVYLPRYGMMDNASRLANFLGQAAHETAKFRYLKEIWGPTTAQRGYEGRADLGNTQPGDGRRYMGRGIFQLTGRANYRQMGTRLGLPLEESPELVEQPDTAVLTACEFWKVRALSTLADQGMDDTITRRINGGTNGIEDRRALVARMKSLLA